MSVQLRRDGQEAEQWIPKEFRMRFLLCERTGECAASGRVKGHGSEERECKLPTS